MGEPREPEAGRATKRVVTSLGSAIAQVADEKRVAARHAFRRRPPSAEAPRAVYLDACRRIGEAFAADGFRYAPSRGRLTRRGGEWTDTLWFQSSHHNVAGVHVALCTGVLLASRRLQRWRRQHASPFRRDADVVAALVKDPPRLATALLREDLPMLQRPPWRSSCAPRG